MWSFPNPVNEVAARTVAAGVLLMGVGLLVTRQWPILLVLAYGFVARVLTGPTLSPLGQLATRVVVPRLPFAARPVPGPPKRFAQGIGAFVTVTASVAHFGFGADAFALGLVGLLVVFATLESGFGFCAGCTVFAALMRAGAIPESVCEECADISRRLPTPA